MHENKITLKLTEEQFSFLKELATNVSFELSGICDVRPGDKKLTKKAALAEEIELSLKSVQLPATSQV